MVKEKEPANKLLEKKIAIGVEFIESSLQLSQNASLILQNL
ncbi:hypothetical protein [Clostridium sp. DJ247]|nr:hypothetical protein [Clostridium sp. DJ247]